MENQINEFIKNKQYIQCITFLREKTKCYSLIELLCEKVIDDDTIEKSYSFWDEYAIALFYLNKKKKAHDCYNNIFKYVKTNLVEHNVNHYFGNLGFSISSSMKKEYNKLNCLESQIGKENITINNITSLVNSSDSEYSAFNPSIIKTTNGYVCNVRKSNYKFDHNYKYMGSGFVHTNNSLVKFNKDLKINEITEMPRHKMPYPGNFDGWEDIRLFYYKNELHGSFTALSATRDNLQHICISNFQTSTSSYTLLDGYGNNKCQKNWVPIVINSSLYFIYSFYPLTVLKFDENKKNVILHQCSLPGTYNKWRGGSPAISLLELGLEYEGFYLCVIHESSFPKYTHKFVLLKANENDIFEIYNYTPSFCFIDDKIEFCAGIAISHDQTQFILSVGKMDSQVHIVSVNAKVILDSLFNTKLKLIKTPNFIIPENSEKLNSPYTFVTCFFNLEKIEGGKRVNPVSFYIEKSKFLLEQNINMVIFSDDDDIIAKILQMRCEHKNKTKIIKIDISKLPYYKHYDLINNVREQNNYGGLKRTKETPLFTILMWSKFYFLQESIKNSYFNTDYFMWIDFGITYVADCNNYINSFNKKSEKVLVQCINLPTSALVNEIKIPNKWLCYLGGGVFGGNSKYMNKLCDVIDANITDIVSQNLAPLEDGLMSYIAYLHPELFEYYYGDYKDIIDNRPFIYSDVNIWLMLRNIDCSISNNMYKHACHIVKEILSAFNNGYIQLDDNTYTRIIGYYEKLFYDKN
jgi:Bacterial protein of unknown function (HtrL_YibB)